MTVTIDKAVSTHIHSFQVLWHTTCDKGQEIVACSALAMGADQLFVKAALELGISVEVVIPCAKYAEIFSTSEALDEYHCLLNCCQNVHSFPFDDCSEDA